MSYHRPVSGKSTTFEQAARRRIRPRTREDIEREATGLCRLGRFIERTDPSAEASERAERLYDTAAYLAGVVAPMKFLSQGREETTFDRVY